MIICEQIKFHRFFDIIKEDINKRVDRNRLQHNFSINLFLLQNIKKNISNIIKNNFEQ